MIFLRTMCGQIHALETEICPQWQTLEETLTLSPIAVCKDTHNLSQLENNTHFAPVGNKK